MKRCILGLVVHLHGRTDIGRTSLSPAEDDATHNPLRGAAIGLRAVRRFRRPTAKRTIAKYHHVCSGSSALLVPARSEPSCVNHRHVSRRRHVHGAVMKGGYRPASQKNRGALWTDMSTHRKKTYQRHIIL